MLLQTTSYNEDKEFQNVLAKRSAKKQRSDFDRYIEIPNDSGIQSSLGWWKQNQSAYPDLAKMARDVLAVPASGCAVEREFSISGRIATWQRSRLSPKTISDSMIYKNYLVRKRDGLHCEVVDDDDHLPIPEQVGKIPKEWADKWWLEKLQRPIRQSLLDMFDNLDDQEDLYG